MSIKSRILTKLGIFSGLLAGAIYLLFFLLVYMTQTNPLDSQMKSLEFFLYIIVLVVPIYYFRFKMNQGYLRFWQGLVIGGIEAIIFMTLCFLIVFTFVNLDHNILIEYQEAMTSQMTKADSKAQIIKKLGSSGYQNLLDEIKKISAYRVSIREFYKLLVVLPAVVIIAALFRR